MGPKWSGFQSKGNDSKARDESWNREGQVKLLVKLVDKYLDRTSSVRLITSSPNSTLLHSVQDHEHTISRHSLKDVHNHLKFEVKRGNVSRVVSFWLKLRSRFSFFFCGVFTRSEQN